MERRSPRPTGYVGPVAEPSSPFIDEPIIGPAPASLAIAPSIEMQKAAVVSAAREMLAATDYIEFRTPTQGRTPSLVWLAWREQLREVMRGNLGAIPDEPARYQQD
jgi:hypothetical protein